MDELTKITPVHRSIGAVYFLKNANPANTISTILKRRTTASLRIYGREAQETTAIGNPDADNVRDTCSHHAGMTEWDTTHYPVISSSFSVF